MRGEPGKIRMVTGAGIALTGAVLAIGGALAIGPRTNPNEAAYPWALGGIAIAFLGLFILIWGEKVKRRASGLD